jgi:group I intron endonuclease
MITIYKITSPGDDCYIGRTKDLPQRIRVHKSSATHITKKTCSSTILFDKYGFDKCSFEVIEECDESIVKQREQWWIDNTSGVVNVARATRVERTIKEEPIRNYQVAFEEYKKSLIK